MLPEYLCVDWLSKNIYFTDSLHGHIAVCSNDGYHCTQLIKTDEMSNIRGIALHPAESLLYWSDWGNESHIGSAFMDGSDATILIRDVAWPNGIVVDWPSRRIYWIDAADGVIESATIAGKDRRKILSDIPKHPFSIAVYENKLIWCDHGSNSIDYCDKFTGKDHNMLVQGAEYYGE